MIQEILKEVEMATKKFPFWPNDPIHAAAVIQEEAGELIQATLETVYEYPKSSHKDVRKEAVEIAAMVIRFLISFDDGKYEYRQSQQHKQKAVEEVL